MKKLILACVAVVVLLAAGGGWYVMAQRRDPMQQARAALKAGDVRAAAIQLRNAVRDQPGNAEAHALLSQVQLAQGDPVAAEKEIKQAAALHWNKAASEAVLAQSYVAQSKWKEILAELPRSGATPAETAYLLMARAMAQRGLKDLPAAEATIAEAERAAPDDAEVRVAGARLALQQGNREQAVAELDHALAADPKKADALELKAEIIAAGGDRNGAIALMDRALAVSPDAGNLRLERAGLYLAQGQLAKAREDVDATLAKEPRSTAGLYMDMVLLVREGKFKEADVVLQRLDPVIAQFQRGLYFKALIKASVGQVAQAEESAFSYVSRYPRDGDGVRLLARIELNARRPARAIPALVSAVAGGQSDAETLDLLGRAYAMDGKRAEAEQAFKQASSGVRENPAALTRVASSLMQVGDLSGAAADLERSLQIAPAQPGAGEALVATALRMGDLDRAQQALDQLRQRAGDTEAVGILSGMLRLARMDPQGALQQFTATAEKFPDSTAAKLNEAKLLLQSNRRGEAIPVLQDVLAKRPATPEALSLLVQTLLQDNHGPEAMAAVERARAAAPNDLGIVAGQAELYARLGDLPHAQQVLEAAKVDGKTPVQLLPVLGRVQFAAGQNDAAKATFAAWSAAEPNNVAAFRAELELLARLKDIEGAKLVARQATQRSPGNLAPLEAQVALELQDKGIDSALALADRLRADSANMPAAAVLRGDLLMTARRFGDAASAFADEYKREPSAALVLRLAAALQASGDQHRAAVELQGWQSAHPDDPDVAQVLGSMALGARRYDDAERNLQIVLKQRPGDVVALNNLAWVYQAKGDSRALQFAQRAYLSAPTPDVGDTLAWILVSQGDSAKALPILQNAAAARPDNALIKYHLAVALKNLDRRDEAISTLRPLLEPSVKFDDKQAAQQLLADLTKPTPKP